MSMLMSLKQAPAETLDLLVERPELAVVFWMDPNFRPPQTPALFLWIAKLLGHYEPPIKLPEPPPGLARNGEVCQLEKTWHGLDYLLTGRNALAEDAHPANPTTSLLLDGGRPIEGSDHGYGDDRAIEPDAVADFDDFLQTLPVEAFAERFDANALAANTIYPDSWDGPDEQEWLVDAYQRLKAFVATTRDESLGLVIQLS